MNEEVLALVRSLILEEADPDKVDGIDVHLIQKLAPLADSLSRLYFRMEIEGMNSVPPGKALIVGNHNAGITFLEPIGLGARWYMERGSDDVLNWLVHDAMVALPGLRTFLIRAGCVRASHETADAAFERDRKVVVFPGGNQEAFRTYKNRYRIDFAGRKGFIRLAIRHQVPIIPMVIVGGHESFFVLHDGKPLAKLLGLRSLLRSDTCPLFVGLPWGIGLGPIFHLPLPAKSQIRFLETISMDGYAPSDQNNPEALEELYRQVTGSMQQAMDEIAATRKYPVLG